MLYLASQSPRRRELLRQIGVAFEPVAVDVPEVPAADEAPRAYAERLALAKARAGYERVAGPDVRVLGADTVVTIDGRILGKPENEADCLRMLSMLSGRTHRVITAVALVDGHSEAVDAPVSEVTFGEIDEAEQRRYWQSGEPVDKAGGYAIQGRGAVFVRHLSGSYSGVVGLPLYETHALIGRR